MRSATAARAAGGSVCLALALFAVLLARDVWRVESALRTGDARAQVTAIDASAWLADTALPFDVARRVLGVRDDVGFRMAVARARTMTARPSNDVAVRRRLPVKLALVGYEQGRDRVRASVAANALGVIYSTDPDQPDKPAAATALDEFVKAVGLDPNDATAKTNLELLLRQAAGGSLRGRKGASAGEKPGNAGAGRRAGGRGY